MLNRFSAMVRCLRHLTVLVALVAIHYGFTYEPKLRHHQEWKKLVLTHHWPATVCEMDQMHCKNPPKYWTLHGLWPDRAQTCNTSWPFDFTQIQDILVEMNQYWPDLLHPNKSQLWRHEWQKHGTCAASLECLNTQLKYFSKGLELYKQVDLNSVLEKSGIIPSTSYYQMKDIENALKGFYGVVPKIQCLSPRQGETVQTLGQIEICFTKEFQLRNCTESVDNLNDALTAWKSYNEDLHVCDTSANTLYPPVKEHSK
ncbi:ribonuclease T2-like isoform X1 [Xenopus laevis]|uniref:Ribonuclease T2-like isoform X1 n=1 Tax=Xenopus laevis TaxID=8355 RepID=A0A8J1KT27_XENLA|nr:ribonuclease T2-like isoform X1 [Xenopus laevis]